MKGQDASTIWIYGVEYAIDLPRIRDLLGRRSLELNVDSLTAMAPKIGISRQTLSKVVNGGWVPGKNRGAVLTRLVHFLGISWDEVLSPANESAAAA
jgi:hypothetical protein